jgi:hypothetical protein
MKMNWYGPKVSTALHGRLGTNVERAGEIIEDHAKYLISTQGPPRSRPGQPPHIDTSELIQSVDHATDFANLVTHVGSDVPHAYWTEVGTVNMAPRPWLRRACIEKADEVAKELGR